MKSRIFTQTRLASLAVALIVLPLLLVACDRAAPGAVPSPVSPTPTSPTSPPTPYDDPLAEPVLTWHREGGLAGFCDDLLIYADGRAVASSCKEGVQAKLRGGMLSEAQLAQLQGWLADLKPFDVEYTDPATADAMTIHMTFAGAGAAEAGEEEQQAIQAFAAELFATLGPDSDLPTPTPEVFNPLPDEDRAFEAARELLAGELGIDPLEIDRVEVVPQEWSDSCLGLGGPAESCLAVITPGYRVTLDVNGTQRVCRTDQDGSVVRCEPPGGASNAGTIPWEEAEALILSGAVQQVVQTHALEVILTLKDGRTLTTLEPEIDAVMLLIERCPDVCKDMAIATE